MKSQPLLFLLMLITSFHAWAADTPSLDQRVPENTVIFYAHDTSTIREPEYKNFNQALEIFFDSMNDFMEWRFLQQELETLLQDSAGNASLKPLTGDAWAMALLGGDESSWSIPSIFYLARVPDQQKADQILQTVFNTVADLSPKVGEEFDDFRGYGIRSIYGPGMIPGFGLSYAFRDSFLVISNNKPKMMELFESWEIGEQNLSENELYRQTLAHLPDQRHSVLFINLSKITQSLRSLVDMVKGFQDLSKLNLSPSTPGNPFQDVARGIAENPGLQHTMALVDVVLPAAESVQSIGVSWSVSKEGIYTTAGFGKVDWQKMQETLPLQDILNRPPKVFNFYEFLPGKTGNYTAINLVNLHDIWSLIKHFNEKLPEDARYLKFLQELEEQHGYSLEDDLLTWLGDEWAIVRPVMDLNSVLPMNRAAILHKVKDSEQAMKGLDKLALVISRMTQMPLQVQKEDYLGYTIASLSLSIPMMPVIPSWSIVDDTLILASHTALVREMIDIKTNRVASGIRRNTYFRQMQEYVEMPSNKLTFHDIESELYTYREALRRVSSVSELGGVINEDNQMLPFMIMDRISYLLTLWQIHKVSVKNAVLQEDGLLSHKYVLKRDLGNVPPKNYILRYPISLGTRDILVQYASYLQEQGEIDHAIKVLSLLHDFFPQESAYSDSLATLYQEQGEPDKAVDIYDRVLQSQPETAVLIQRELSRLNADAAQIVQNVRATAAKYPKIRADAALFGIALKQREEHRELSTTLFDLIAGEFGTSPLAELAYAESVLLQGANPDNFVEIPRITDAANLESPDSEAWEKALSIPMHMIKSATDSEQNLLLTARFLRSDSHLYVQIQGDALQDMEIIQDQLKVVLSPRRDYIHWQEFHLCSYGESSADDQVLISTINFHDILMPDRIRQEKGDMEWANSINQTGDQWQALLALPLEELTQNAQDEVKNVWLLNLSRTIESGAGEYVFSLAPGINEFIYARMR